MRRRPAIQSGSHIGGDSLLPRYSRGNMFDTYVYPLKLNA